MKTSESILLKYNMKNLMSKVLPIVKKIVNKKINKIKSHVMQKIRSIKKVGSNKKVSNDREIKSLENNLSAEATKNITNAPEIAIEKSPVFVKPNVVTSSKIATKPKIVVKANIVVKPNVVTSSKIATKPKITIKKKYINYNEYKNHVIKQFKRHFKKLIDV